MKVIPEQSEGLREVLTNDPAQLQRFEQLRTELDHRLGMLAYVIDLRRAQGAEAARSIVAAGEGQRSMTRIRQLGAEIHSANRENLRNQAERESRAVARTYLLIGLASLVSFLSVVGASIATARHLRRRRVAEEAVARGSALLRATLDSLSHGVAVFDPDRRLATFNQRFVQLAGIDSVELLKPGVKMDDIPLATPSRPTRTPPSTRSRAAASSRRCAPGCSTAARWSRSPTSPSASAPSGSRTSSSRR